MGGLDTGMFSIVLLLAEHCWPHKNTIDFIDFALVTKLKAEEDGDIIVTAFQKQKTENESCLIFNSIMYLMDLFACLFCTFYPFVTSR